MGQYRTLILTGLLGLTLVAPALAQQEDEDQRQQGDRGEHYERGHQMLRMRGMDRMIAPLARAFANGTLFRIRVGENEIDMHCPASLPLQSCVSAATEMLKAMQTSQ